MIVAYRNGAPVHLADLGTVVDGVEDQHTASRFYTRDTDQPAIVLGIQRQPGTNTMAVADAVKDLIPQFRDELPAERPHGHAVRPVGHDPRVVPRRAVHDAR